MRWYYLEREEDCLEFPWGGCQVSLLLKFNQEPKIMD
jgi:hypothetical protein